MGEFSTSGSFKIQSFVTLIFGGPLSVICSFLQNLLPLNPADKLEVSNVPNSVRPGSVDHDNSFKCHIQKANEGEEETLEEAHEPQVTKEEEEGMGHGVQLSPMSPDVTIQMCWPDGPLFFQQRP